MDSFKVISREGAVGDNDRLMIKEVFFNDCYNAKRLYEEGFNPSVIFDIGGHIGSFSILSRFLWPESKIFAFEGWRPAIDQFLANLKENNISDIELFPFVSYDTSKTVVVGGAKNFANTFITTPEEADALVRGLPVHDPTLHNFRVTESNFIVYKEPVVTITLEEVIDKFDIETVDLLKIDCEGSELDIFTNMSDSTTRKIKYIVGEYHTKTSFEEDLAPLLRRRFPHLEFRGMDHIAWVGYFTGAPK